MERVEGALGHGVDRVLRDQAATLYGKASIDQKIGWLERSAVHDQAALLGKVSREDQAFLFGRAPAVEKVAIFGRVDKDAQAAMLGRVNITADALQRRTFTGKVHRIAPQGTIENNVTVFQVLVAVGPRGSKSLRPQMSANIEVVVTERPPAVLVPRRRSRARETTG